MYPINQIQTVMGIRQKLLVFVFKWNVNIEIIDQCVGMLNVNVIKIMLNVLNLLVFNFLMVC